MFGKTRAFLHRNTMLGLTVLVPALGLGVVDQSYAAGVEWGYSGNEGPENWGKDYPTCAMGRNQSPLDIVTERVLDISELVDEGQTVGSRPAGFLKIEPAYQDVPLIIINNGHSVQVNYEPGSVMTVHGRSRELKQFHFHAPSENRIGGESFPMEAHFVHADENGNLTVIGVLFVEGEANPLIETLWKHLPTEIGKEVAVSDQIINAAELLPEDTRYYYYNGSLTTPPCSEGVAWLLLKRPVEVSSEQLETFRSALGFANNRPVQSVNSRVIVGW